MHDTHTAWVVDPGDHAPVVQTLEKLGCQLAGILITHHHWDHTDGAQKLHQKYSVPIYGPANSPYQHIDHALKDGDELSVLDRRFSILSIPGHTLDHIAYYSAATETSNPWLFCGDVLFAAGCGRVFEGDAAMMWDSLSKLAALPDNTEVYCAHEYTVSNLHFAAHIEPNNPTIRERLRSETEKRTKNIPTLPTSMLLEHDTNPFLRVAHQDLLKAMDISGQDDGSDPVSVFANLRAQKDTFQVQKK